MKESYIRMQSDTCVHLSIKFQDYDYLVILVAKHYIESKILVVNGIHKNMLLNDTRFIQWIKNQMFIYNVKLTTEMQTQIGKFFLEDNLDEIPKFLGGFEPTLFIQAQKLNIIKYDYEF